MSHYDYHESAERARSGARFDAERDDHEGYHSVNPVSDACGEATGAVAAGVSGLAGAFGAALGGLIVLAFMIFWRLPIAGKVLFVSILSLIIGGTYLDNRSQRASYNEHLAIAKQGAPVLHSALSRISARRIQELSRPPGEETLQDGHLLKVAIPRHDAFFAVVFGALPQGYAHRLKITHATFLPAGSLDAHAAQGKVSTPVRIDLQRNACSLVKVDMVSGPPDTTPVDMHGLGAPFYKKHFGMMFFLVVCTNPGTSNFLIDEDLNGMSYEGAFSHMVERQVRS